MNRKMNYEKIYEDYYSKSYDRIELLIKKFLIKRHSQKKAFIKPINAVIQYLEFDFKSKHIVFNHEMLNKLSLDFYNRHSEYSSDATKEILENEIKIEFDKIKLSELPENYNYSKFIKDIALIEVVKEFSRLIRVNLRLLTMFYEGNKLEEFEIREYQNLLLDDYPIFKKLHRELYPDYYMYKLENDDKGLGIQLKTEINYLGQPINDKASELFEFLIQYYRPDEISSVKYINILHYLKKDANKELYIFKVNQKKFKKMIIENVGIEIKKFAKSERYSEDEKPLLNSLERSFRKN